ncbi:MAG TPA: FadR/GntR family transcriptional regulator [bacterium]|nr:FadR/GntR family transcriptional regulator [bacterium]
MSTRRSSHRPVELRPIERARVYEAIVAQLQELILHGPLRPGDRLPSERELVGRFGVSRVSVRQALAVLHAMGLIQIRSGGGVFAARTARGGVLAVAAALTGGRDLTRAQMEVRLIVEPRAAALAAQRATRADLRALAAALEGQARGIPTPELGLRGDAQFHTTIAEAAKNPLLLKMVEVITDALMPSREASARVPGGPQRAIQEHRRILRAIQRRDPRAAEQLMRAHLLTVERLALGPGTAGRVVPRARGILAVRPSRASSQRRRG